MAGRPLGETRPQGSGMSWSQGEQETDAPDRITGYDAADKATGSNKVIAMA